jgi:hypothetical protein
LCGPVGTDTHYFIASDPEHGPASPPGQPSDSETESTGGPTDSWTGVVDPRCDQGSLHLACWLCVLPPFSANTEWESPRVSTFSPPHPRPGTDRSAPPQSPTCAGCAARARGSAAARRCLSGPCRQRALQLGDLEEGASGPSGSQSPLQSQALSLPGASGAESN